MLPRSLVAYLDLGVNERVGLLNDEQALADAAYKGDTRGVGRFKFEDEHLKVGDSEADSATE